MRDNNGTSPLWLWAGRCCRQAAGRTGRRSIVTDKAKAASPVERIYVLDGGIAEVADASIYSPGIDIGKSLSLSCNAYLIRRAGQWILWDTGIDDKLANVPGGRIIAHDIRGILKRTLRSQ